MWNNKYSLAFIIETIKIHISTTQLEKKMNTLFQNAREIIMDDEFPKEEKDYCLWWKGCIWSPKRLEEIKQSRISKENSVFA